MKGSMAHEEDKMPPIEPPVERWEPKSDPSMIEIPELNTSAPPQEQLEQLDQIITIRLQNIDANMSRAHFILSEKILPTVKRYNLNTEPVREAARFWIQLFEQAAKIRIPGPEDISFGLHQEEEAAEEEMQQEDMHMQGNGSHDSHAFDPNVTPSESSFAPEQAAVSSTPMVASTTRQAGTNSALWSESLQSPLERLDKGLKSLGHDDTTITHSRDQKGFQDSVSSVASSSRGPVFTAPDKGKSKEKPTLLQNVLTKNIKNAANDLTSPLKIRKTPKKNPFAPANGPKWDGIVDLTKHAPQKDPAADSGDWSSEDEMDFAPPQRSPAKRPAAHIGRTPKKEAAARIGRDLIGDAERFQQRYRQEAYGYGSEDQTLSTPSLSNYSKRALGIENADDSTSQAESSHSRNITVSESDRSIGEAMQRFGLGSSLAQQRQSEGGGGGDDSFDDSFDDTVGPVFQGLNTLAEDPGNDDSGDSSDEDSFNGNNPGPSAAFLLASSRQRRETGDSYGGSDHSSDSMDPDDGAGAAPIHPFAHLQQRQGDDSFDDSFDAGDVGGINADESTVFGVRPMPRGGQRLTLLGQHLVDDTDTVQLTGGIGPSVPETPTPANQVDNR